MPKNWKTYNLLDFIDINPRMKFNFDEEYSFVEMKDLDPNIRRVLPLNIKKLKGGSKFQNSDTLFARITPCLQNGKICQVQGLNNNIGFGSTEFLVFRGKENVSDNDFVYYLSREPFVRQFAESNMIGTSGRQRVTKEAFQNLELNLPPLPEQTQIANILSAIDDKIENNLAINKTLEDMAMALYKHWFVDFGPFQDGEFIDSELGLIPKGWEVKRLKDFINLNPRLTIPKSTISSYVEMKILPINLMSVSNVVKKEFKGGSKFQNDDTLFARITPCLENGKMAFVDFLKDDEIAFGSTEFLVMRAKQGVSKYWVYCLAKDSNFRKFSISTMVGSSGRQRVQNDPFLSFELAKPSSEIFNSFSKTIEPWFSQVRLNTFANQSLTNLRDTLLPKLISGEVRLKEFREGIDAEMNSA
jgi:type I restriction enzyme S subunit